MAITQDIEVATSKTRRSTKATAQKPAARSRLSAGFDQDIHEDSLKVIVKRFGLEEIQELLDTAAFDLQRKLRPDHVGELADAISNDELVPGTQIYFCVLPDGRLQQVDGSHRFHACLAAGKSYEFTATYKRVANLEEVGWLYARFDNHKKRTAGDSIRAVGKGDIPFSAKVYAAINVIEQEFRGIFQPHREDVLRLMDRYKEPAELYYMSLKTEHVDDGRLQRPKATHVQLLKRAGIMAVALETLRQQPHAGCNFWERVALDDIVLKRGDPEKSLNHFLSDNRDKANAGRKFQRNNVKAAACAWNAKWRGQSPGFLKPEAMKSLYLEGTTWRRARGD